MAVYKIFSEKDAAIYSDAPTQNTGRDEILDISSFNALNVPGLGEDIQVARALVQFPSSEINDLISNNVTGSYKAYLKYAYWKLQQCQENIAPWNLPWPSARFLRRFFHQPF